MIPAPLRLERSFFDEIRLTTRKDYDNSTAEQNIEIENNLELGQLAESKGTWKVVLVLRVKAKENAPPPPYEFHIRSIGFFTVNRPGPTEEETARMVGINGASILYSSAREFLLAITGRCPWGPMTLPTVSFIDLKIEGKAPVKGKKRASRKSSAKTPVKKRTKAKHKPDGQKGKDS